MADKPSLKQPPGIACLRERLARWAAGTGFDLNGVYIVGGSVRDAFLSRPCGDLDICLHGAEAFARAVAKKRRAAFVPMEKDPSAPCYRVVSRKDPGDYLDVAEIRGPDIGADLAARDFTVNAMALPAASPADAPRASALDPFQGLADLSARLIRHVSDKNLKDDPLRVLRAFRLAASLDFSIAPETAPALAAAAPGLSRVAGERIGQEVLCLLASPRAYAGLASMDESGVLGILFPELAPLRGLAQNRFHNLDAFAHTMEAVRHTEEILNGPEAHFPACGPEIRGYLSERNRPALIKLAALLHDAGKPATRGVNPRTGANSFHGHEAVSAEMFLSVAARLKLSKRDRDFTAKIIGEHLRPLILSARDVNEKKRIRWMRNMGDDCVGALILSMADNMSKAKVVDEQNRPARLSAWLCEYFSIFRPRFAEKPLVSGRDLLDLGASPGPQMGGILDEIRRARDAGEIADREGALSLARTLLARG